jgi:hypothetical protein
MTYDIVLIKTPQTALKYYLFGLKQTDLAHTATLGLHMCTCHMQPRHHVVRKSLIRIVLALNTYIHVTVCSSPAFFSVLPVLYTISGFHGSKAAPRHNSRLMDVVKVINMWLCQAFASRASAIRTVAQTTQLPASSIHCCAVKAQV